MCTDNAAVGLDKYPRQGEFFGRRVKVLFRGDMAVKLTGQIVRFDIEEPYVTVMRLDDGRHVLGSECLYSAEPLENE